MPLHQPQTTHHLQPILPSSNTTGAWQRDEERTLLLRNCTKTMRDLQLCRFERCSTAAWLLGVKCSTAFPWAQPLWGTGTVTQMSPLTFTAKTVLEILWEELSIWWGEKEAFTRGVSNRKNYVGAPLESQNLTRGQGGWSKPHAMEQIGQDGSSEALTELDQWLSTTGLHQAGIWSPTPNFICICIWPPVWMSGKDELGQQHLGWTQIRP